MSRPSSDNTTSNHNISTSSQQKAVFNYAQAARKSNPPVNTNGQPAPVNGGVKQPQQQQQQQQQQTQPQQQQPSFAAALQKSSNPYSSAKDLQVPSPHQQPQQPYQQRHAHYQGRHHYNPSNKHAGVNHSPNMQHSQPFYMQQSFESHHYYTPYPTMPISPYGNMSGVQGQQGGRSPSQPFIHSTPPRSKAIPIINPETMAQVKTDTPSTGSSPSRKDASPVIPKAEEKKEKIEIKPAGSPSRAIKIVDPAIKEREEREKREKEEADKLAKEEAERKAQEEKEREVQEAKERAEREEREKREEAERLERERIAAEQKEQERLAAEQKAKEEEERRLEEERLAREREEKERLEKEEAAKKVEEEAKLQREREEAEHADKKQEERIAAIAAAKSSRGPGRLDLSAIPPHVAQAMPTPVSTVEPPKSKVPSLISRTIDPTKISYPEEVQPPAQSKPGVQQYDVAFLMQFALLCTDTAEDLSAFENVGIDDQNDRGSRPGMQRRQTSERGRGPRTPGSPMGKDGKFEMGKFAGGRSLAPRQGSGSHSLPAPGSPGGMQRDGSHGGRSRSGRGGKGRHPPREQPGGPTIPLDQVVPLEKSENRWVPTTLDDSERAAANAALEAEIIPEDIVIRKVKSLLNKLTLEKFESISSQILEYANQSAKEVDGKTLRVVIQLVFEKATDESQFAQMWAQLCRKMLDNISSDIRDENVKDNKGQYVTGSNLFRKYLLNRCQEDFERGWKGKLPDMPDTDSGMLSDEYYAAVKAKRQGLGLIRLIGELFKLQMLTERIMHECIKKLLSNVSDPEEEETESLCKLMTTVGKDLDHPKAKGWMDIYFERIKELQSNNKLSSRIRFMIQDVIDLRKSKWTLRQGQGPSGPATIAQIHEEAAKAKEREEKEAMKRTPSSRGNPMSRASSHRGKEMQREGSSSSVGPDGWSTVGNASPTGPARKAGDLANFGKIERSKSRNGVLGPGSSPFASLSAANRQSSKSGEKKVVSDEKASVSANADSSIGHEEEKAPLERKRLQLLPRGATSGSDIVSSPVSQTATESAAAAAAATTAAPASTPKMSEDEAKRKIKNMFEEFYGIKDKNELYECIKDLGSNEFHPQWVQYGMGVVESKAEDVELVKEVFAGVQERVLISKDDFQKGIRQFMDEIYEDLRIDVPLAPKYVPQLITAAGFDPKEFMEN
ncbi:armadillo-type protein [Umbelopsis sp. PMI_123]|nr:armadillo-type protein [Umbelopsis sp. PMI_123]